MTCAATSAAEWLRAVGIGVGTWTAAAVLLKAALDYEPAPQEERALEAPPATADVVPLEASPAPAAADALEVPPCPTEPPNIPARHAKPAAPDETTPLHTVRPRHARHSKDTSHATC